MNASSAGADGQEDECWAIALQAICGKAWRGDAPLVHLHHPPAERLTRRRGSPESWKLRHRYGQARRNSEQMKELISGCR